MLIKLLYHYCRKILSSIIIPLVTLIQDNSVFDELFETCKELYITHNFAGGTRSYEKNYLVQRKDVYIIRNVLTFRTVYLSLETIKGEDKYYFKVNDFPRILSKLPKVKITVSSLVSYTNVKQMLLFFIEHKSITNIPISYLVHDFHCVCPNYTLINKDGYCQLHCSSKCNYSLRVKQWRSIWYHFLSEIDEIRVFSQSSKNVITNVYPRIPQGAFAVVPHDMSYCKFKPYETSDNKEKRLAIVGTCDTIAKGKEIVNDFLVKYQDRGVVIFGNTPLRRKAKKNRLVINYGKYINSELPSLMQRYNVDTVVFPSICEETFSYTVSELMLLNVNIVCFNIGAQAEKVKSYKNGFIADQMTTESLIITVRNVR